MKIARVQYTAKEDFVETNKQNINAVMEELRALNNPNVKYSTYLLEDGRTFMHFAVGTDEEAVKVIGQLESFKQFRAELAEGAEAKPQAQNAELVGSSFDWF